MQKKILIIDDDEEISELISRWLELRGYRAVTAYNGTEGLRQIYKERPDLVILDIMMPGMDGWSVCRRIREMSEIPVIILSARAEPADRIMGLDLGADDYITKPFEYGELLARVAAILRRTDSSQERSPSLFEVDGLAVDFRNRNVMRDGCEVKLSPKEFKVLAYLLQNPGRVVTQDQILAHVWGPEYAGAAPGYVKLYVRYLREKLEKDPSRPRLILTERGVGYRFARMECSGN